MTDRGRATSTEAGFQRGRRLFRHGWPVLHGRDPHVCCSRETVGSCPTGGTGEVT